MSWSVLKPQQVDISRLRSGGVAVIGYGNQGRAHALNLRDSGIPVVVGQREGKSFNIARGDGFHPLSLDQAARNASLIILTLPDEWAADIFETEFAASIRSGQTLGFVHGFNVHFGLIHPPNGVDVVMIAPKGPGTLLRELFIAGRGLPALLAVSGESSKSAREVALAWAAGIGCTRAGIVETTFATETVTDLFGEQAVLCGGVTALAKAAFETLVEAGFEPEFAYLECVHELKQVVDLLYARGLTGMRQRISNTARYGDVTRGPRVINSETKQRMGQILSEVQSGFFANEWLNECRAGATHLRQLCQADTASAFERAGKEVRSLMPWLESADETEI